MCSEKPQVITIHKTALQILIRNCQSELPFEACGILSGTSRRIESVLPILNRSAKPHAGFTFDPQHWIGAYYDVRGKGEHILGFYHSHPSGRPLPSASDYAGWPIGMDASLWIAAFHENKKPVSVHAYRMKDGRFVPLEIVQKDSADQQLF